MARPPFGASPGRPLEADGNVRSRWMVTASGLGRMTQNPAYRPAPPLIGPSRLFGLRYCVTRNRPGGPEEGSRTLTDVPLSGELLMWIDPPWLSTIRRLMYSPSPTPALFSFA